MDPCDADQEGRTLPPHHEPRTINAGQDEFLRLVARDEASKAIQAHLRWCPMIDQKIPERLRSLELSFWKLAGFMLGSGIFGGVTGGLLAKLLN